MIIFKMFVLFAESATSYMLVKLSRRLLLQGIPISIVTLPFEERGNYTEEDIEKFSKSKSLMIFTLSDTKAVHDYLKMVRK